MDEERRYGNPRTDEERAERHASRYPGEPLPERGTGLTRISQGSSVNIPVIAVSALLITVFGVIFSEAAKRARS